MEVADQKNIFMVRPMIFGLLLFASCTAVVDQKQIQKAKEEILQTERDFESMAGSKGIPEAFSYYADSSACLNRGGIIVHGKDSIRIFYSAPGYKEVQLEWDPDFVEVSASADLGYTYGNYTSTIRDSAGRMIRSEGVFHTVWKRQAGGEWRYVWD
jgi:ketosteroid isomerase-like protein